MWSLLIALLYPPACLLCHGTVTEEAAVLCERCRSALPAVAKPGCPRCGLSLSAAYDACVTCAACRRRPPAFDHAAAVWEYRDTGATLIRQIKQQRRWRLSRWAAQQLATTADTALPLTEINAVVAVPHHRLTRWLRGYDPAELLARDVAHRVRKPYLSHALRQIKWTQQQHRLPSKAARFRNVRRAFAASRRLVDRQAILLIDDVMTSRATAHACAAALKASGARAVYVVTAARTPTR